LGGKTVEARFDMTAYYVSAEKLQNKLLQTRDCRYSGRASGAAGPATGAKIVSRSRNDFR